MRFTLVSCWGVIYCGFGGDLFVMLVVIVFGLR